MITEKDLPLRDYVLVIDGSGSMGESLKVGGKQSRWAAAQETTLALARKCAEFDSDGIDVYTFNNKFKRFPNTTPEKVAEIFSTVSPCGGTDFVPVLKDVFANHFKTGKPTTVLVITDGEPSDGSDGEKALAKLIIDTANKLEGDGELGISFIQIGQDPKAAAFLKKLDDKLEEAGAKWDIVDTKNLDDLETVSITDVLLGAVND